MSETLLITDIQHFSVHDGPGIRTTVFTKGCPLRCLWCHNPETLSARIRLKVETGRCVGCGACLSRCPKGAISLSDGKAVTDRAKCVDCLACAAVCPTDARHADGRRVTTDDVAAEILRDRDYYVGGGGATISGGEPLLQSEGVFALTKRLHDEGIHVAVETALSVPEEVATAATERFDLFLCDVKALPAELHRRLTGRDNALILANLRRIAERGKPLLLRMPLIPGLNDGEENLAATAAFIRSLPGETPELEILPYHALGADKYAALGLEYKANGVVVPDREYVDAVKDRFRRLGVALKG